VNLAVFIVLNEAQFKRGYSTQFMPKVGIGVRHSRADSASSRISFIQI